MSMTLESLPATSRIMSYGEYQLLGYKGLDFEWHMRVLASYAKLLSSEVFGMVREDAAREVMFNMSNSGSIIIATVRDTGEAVAYSTQRILEPVVDGSRIRVMYTSTRAVKCEHEGKGVGPATLQYAFSMHDAPDILGGRTGMAPVVELYSKSGLIAEGKLYPFDRPYGESRAMQEVLKYVASQTREKHPINENTGLMEEVYDKDSDQVYDPEKASSRVQAIRERMIIEFGLRPMRGDAMIVLGVKRGWTRFVD